MLSWKAVKMIENNVKAAFNEIHAEQSLKQETKQFIYNKIYKNDKAENKSDKIRTCLLLKTNIDDEKYNR